ncbi:hypothetical protein DENSPDRAFT_831759, partial [Dentipellis sp. KUC8613]
MRRPHALAPACTSFLAPPLSASPLLHCPPMDVLTDLTSFDVISVGDSISPDSISISSIEDDLSVLIDSDHLSGTFGSFCII